MTIERRNYALTVEVRAKKEEEGEGNRASGYAAVFNSDSHDLGGFVERIKPGAFTRSLKSAESGEHRIYMLWSHDMAQPLGSTGARNAGVLVLREDDTGLAFEMDTTRMTAAQIAALDEGDLRMSFGFSVREQEWREDDEGNIDRTLVDVDLFEVSFVISPAYPDTSAALRSLEEWRAGRAAHDTTEVEEFVISKPNTIEARKAAMRASLKARGYK